MRKAPKHILTKNFLSIGKKYFDEVAKPSLKETQKIVSPVKKTYVIAGKKVCVYFYGKVLENIFSQALSHHKTSNNPIPDLIIHTWDSTLTKKGLMPPWDRPGFKNERLAKTDYFFGVYVGGEESLNFYDSENATGYFWTQDASKLPDWVLGAPFRTILHWFLNESNIHLIHGAVVGQNNSSILLTAKSGSGKSTTSLSSLLSGMDYLGDDYVALEHDKKILAHSLYHSAKITRQGLELFPELKKSVWNKNFGDKEKAVIFLSEIFPKQIKSRSTLRAIFIPRIGAFKTHIVKASKMEAMLAIAPTTLLQLPMAETKKVSVFKNILLQIPCYFLELGPDIRNIPKTLKEFLSKTF